MGCGTGDPHRVLKGKVTVHLRLEDWDDGDPFVSDILVEGPDHNVLRKRAETIAKQGVWRKERFFPPSVVTSVDLEVVK